MLAENIENLADNDDVEGCDGFVGDKCDKRNGDGGNTTWKAALLWAEKKISHES